MPNLYIIFERTNILGAISIDKCAFSVLFVGLKGSDILVSGQLRINTPSFCTLAILKPIFKVSNVCGPIGVGVCARLVKKAISE